MSNNNTTILFTKISKHSDMRENQYTYLFTYMDVKKAITMKGVLFEIFCDPCFIDSITIFSLKIKC